MRRAVLRASTGGMIEKIISEDKMKDLSSEASSTPASRALWRVASLSWMSVC